MVRHFQHHCDEFTLLDFGMIEVWTLSWNKKIDGKTYGDYIVYESLPTIEQMNTDWGLLEEQARLVVEEVELGKEVFTDD